MPVDRLGHVGRDVRLALPVDVLAQVGHVAWRRSRASSGSTRRRRPPPPARSSDRPPASRPRPPCASRRTSSSGMWPICQSPYISLPTAQSFTPKGRVLPFSARLRPSGVVAAPFAYSTSSRADSGPSLAGVDRDVRLGADQAHQVHELVEAHVVVLDALPGRVLARRPAVGVADAVLPVVPAHEVAARPAVDGGVELAEESEGVRAPAQHVVDRHQRHGPDRERARAARARSRAGRCRSCRSTRKRRA